MGAWGLSATGRSRWLVRAVLVVAALFTVITVRAVGQAPEESGLLWVAESNGVLALDTASGEILLAIPTDRPAQAVAVDHVESRVWALSDRDELTAFDFAGEPLATVTPPAPIGPDAELIVDAPAGTLWLRAARALYRFDSDGTFRQEFAFAPGEQLRGLALDEARSRLWLATRDALIAFGPDGSETHRIAVPDLGPLGVGAIAFDPFLDALWVVGHERVQRYDADGGRVFDGPAPRLLEFVDADGQGGAWVASTIAMHHIDRSGLVGPGVQPPGAPQGTVRALQADPADGSAWLAGVMQLRHYAIDGTLLRTVAPEPMRGRPRLLSGLALPSGPAVRVAVTEPADGSLINDNPPPVELAVEGLSVPADRIALTANDEDAPAACQALDGGLFHCTPWADLPQGDNEIAAAVANDAGTRFESEPVVFELDSIAPAITIDHPPEHHITNAPELDLRGSVSEPATLTLNGESIVVGDDLGFRQAIALVEGDNPFTLQAQDPAGNVGVVQRTVTLDTVPPGAPDGGRIAVEPTDDGQVQVTGETGSVEPGSEVAVTNQTTGETVIVIADANGGFQAVIAGESSGSFVVVARDRAGNASAAVEIAGSASPSDIPPDPATVAPDLPQVGSPPLAERIEFLYTGANPIQRDVAPGTIEARRVSVLRGAVRDRAGAPIPGVKVTVLRHPELGHTLTRADGVFDLAVNGGGLLTVVYEKPGLLPAQRTVQTQWNDWFVADDVVMIPLDPRVTTIDLTDASRPFQVAQGSMVEDSDGRRQVTMLFPAGTTAEITRPDGSKVQLDRLDVRATEYTVGESGPDAMPAPLPPSSAYTYAVELSVDQARQQGVKVDGKDVVFNQPVPFYVDNFLDFPTGEAVPVGYYNSDIAAWVPYPNGRIVEILSKENGHAVLDVAGGGQPATADALAALGITDAELVQLAEVYEPGISLWRVPLSHFSTWDHNWPFGPPPDAERPDVDLPKRDELPDSDEDCHFPGCTIASQAQSVGESIVIAGTPYALHYQSERAPGYKRNRVVIPLTGETIPTSLQSVRLTVTIAGQREVRSFAAAPNLSHAFEWEGRDSMGREVSGAATAVVELSYVYPCSYRPGDNGFAQFGSSATPIGTRERCQGFALSRRSEIALKPPLRQSSTLANWGLSVEHVFDQKEGVLLLGDGRRRSLSTPIIETVAGTGVSGFSGDGGLATEARLRAPESIATGADGSLYIADTSNDRIRRVTPDGIIDTIAGIGFGHFSGDGGPAVSAPLSSPYGIAVGADGSLYIADAGNHRIRRVTPDGVIDTVAGMGFGLSGDGGPATQARLAGPRDVAIGTDGSLYIADAGNNRIRRVTPDGIIDTIAGSGPVGFLGGGFSGDGDFATVARFNFPTRLDIGADGSVYIADTFNDRIRRVTPDGIIDTVAGTGKHDLFGDGGPATQARLDTPFGVAIGPDGSLYIAHRCRIRRVSSDGIIDTIAGTGTFGFSGDGGPATAARVCPESVTVAADGSLYAAERTNQRIRRVTRTGRQFIENGNLAIPSEDGAHRFVFDTAGRHLRTEDTQTGQTLLSFDRDAEGRVLSVTNGDGNVTTIERDSNGHPTAIVAPHGQRTGLTVDGNGHLTRVADPTGATWAMQYTDDGLLTDITHPNGQANTFAYDADGRLLRDLDPEGGGWQLSRTDLEAGTRTEMISGEGRVRSFTVERQSNGTRTYTDQAPDGTKTLRTYTEAGGTTIAQPDGTVLFTKEGPDPRFKMDAPVIAERRLTLPSGLAFLQTTNRAASLTNPTDALSLTSLTDTVTTNGRVQKAAYDAVARRWTFTSPAKRVVTLTVDSQSRPLTQTVAGLEPVATSYDTRGRPNFVLQGLGSDARLASFDYYDASTGDQAGFLRAITDPLGRETAFTYDGAGRVTSQTLPDGRTIGFQYDAQGNLAALTPPGRSAHLFDYDGLNQATAYTPPDLAGIDTITRYRYNLDRQVTAIERPGGETVSFDYDTGGRLASRTLPTGVTRYGYTASTGQLAEIAGPDVIDLAFEWDGFLSKATTWSGPVNGRVGYRFDNNLWPIEETVNGETVAFGYDNDGVLIRAGALNLDRNAGNGLLTGTTLDAVEEAFAYNGFGEVIGRDVTVLGTPSFQVDYSRDKLGRIAEQTETVASASVATFAYTYDAAGRLTDVHRNGGLIERYSYDANSNRATKTTSAGTTSYAYDDQDRLLEASGPGGATTYAYSAAGDLRTKTGPTGTTTYDYDAAGNLRSVGLPNGTAIDYLIDGQDRRVGKRVDGVLVTGWLYRDQLNPVAELDGQGNVVARFVYADRPNVPAYMVKDGRTYRIVSDHLGSPRLVIDASTGEIVQRMDYDSFGNVVADSNPGFQPFGFAGGQYDPDTRLVRFGARDYDPESGRWTAKDPISFAGGDTNLYGYVLNDPVNLIDPTGQIVPLILGGAVIGAIVNTAVQAGQNIASGRSITSGLGAAAVAGALSGAVGAVAGPLGGTIARALGGRATGLLARSLSTGISAGGGALGQAAQNALNSCSSGDIADAAGFAGAGGLVASFLPNQGLRTIAQARFFAPQSASSFLRSPGGAGAALVSSGIGTGASFGGGPSCGCR